jgi:methyl-accepting chemotaxis protein
MLRFSFALPLSVKLPAIIVVSALLAALVIGVVSYLGAASSLRQAADEKLAILLNSRAESLTSYLETTRRDLVALATSPSVAEALQNLNGAMSFMSNPTADLERAYVTNNPHPLGERDKLDQSAEGLGYDDPHAKSHPWFRNFMRERGLQDILLLDPNGIVAYSVAKANDFAHTVSDDILKDTALAKIFANAKANPKIGYLTFTDFAPYTPHGNQMMALFGSPIVDKYDTFIGVAVIAFSSQHIGQILDPEVSRSREQVMLVGQDMLLRSPDKTTPDTPYHALEIMPVKNGLSGAQGLVEYQDPSLGYALAAYAPLKFLDQSWGLIARASLSVVLEPVFKMRTFLLAIGGGAFVVLSLVGWLIGRGISRPILKLTQAMAALAAGNLTTLIPATGRRDELGRMAQAVEIFKNNALEVERLHHQQAAMEEKAKSEKRATLETLASGFETTVKGLVEHLSLQAGTLRGTAQTMSQTVGEANRHSQHAADSAQEAAENAGSVARAIDELNGAIRDISQLVSKSSNIAAQALEETDRISAEVERLSDASRQIGDVLDLIGSIAAQTNLLALNATIEAARAGEAGRGFAVVAQEVKNLANQTASATEQVATQIHGMQGATRTAVDLVKTISGIIGNVNQIATMIAAAVEQQSASTQDINSNVQRAAERSQIVLTTIGDVSSACEATGSAAGEVLDAAGNLSGNSQSLRVEVERFLDGVRAASHA